MNVGGIFKEKFEILTKWPTSFKEGQILQDFAKMVCEIYGWEHSCDSQCWYPQIQVNLLSVKSYKMSTIFCVRSHILSWKWKQQSKKPAFCLSWEGCKIMTKETVISFDSFHTKVISLLIDTWFQLGKNVINNKIADGLYELFTEHT